MRAFNLNFPVLFVTALGLSVSTFALGEPETSPYQHDIQATQSCDSCHEQSKVDIFNSNKANDCMECHAPDESDSITRVENKKFVDIYADKIEVEPPLAATTGMSVPMYYNETRIGKEPNPMVLVPAGPYIRGSDNRLPDEGPQYTAETGAFWIDKYEVTNLQYKQFIDATKRKSPSHFRSRTYPDGKIDHPVVFVSWHDAHDYCEWAGKRLPTDIEWEKAARGDADDRDYPWGDTFEVERVNSPVRWKALHLRGDTTPVGSMEGGKSPYGVYDLSGNVWEWTDSWYIQYPGSTWPSQNYGELYKVLKGD